MTAFWNARAAEGWCDPVSPAGPSPGVEDPEVRLRLRAEIDAIVASDLYGLTIDELVCMLDTFPIVKRKDEEKYGSYRTKEIILAVYDDMQDAMRMTGNGPPRR